MNVDAVGNVRIYEQREPAGMAFESDKGAILNKPKKGKKTEGKLPRPPNMFILYRQHHHPLIKSQEPWLHNNQICKFQASSLLFWLIRFSHYTG